MISYDQDAILKWDVYEDGSFKENSYPVYVSEESVKRQEFYASYQAGMNPIIVFNVNYLEFEETKHIDKDTKKPLYATQIEFDGALYDIIRTYRIKNSDNIELTCG